MLIITVFFWVSTFIALVAKFKEKINPIIFIFHYFYGMLFFSQLSLTGIPKPSEMAVFYFLIAYVSIFIGVFFCRVKPIYKKDTLQKQHNFILYFVLVFAAFPLTYVLYHNISFILKGYDQFVQVVRFERDTVSITGSTMMASVVDRVVRPVSVFAAVMGMSFYITSKRKIILLLGCYLLVVFSILYVKRIDLMFLLAIMIGGFLSAVNVSRVEEGSKYKKYIYFAFMLYIILEISASRASSYSVYQLFLHYGIGYHTYGFALFDYALNNPFSHIHDWVVPGTTIFSTIDFFSNQLYRAFGVVHTPISSYLYSNELGEQVFMGYNKFNGDEISPNAFYTSMYPIYRDMKIFGLIVVPLIYGYCFSKSYQNFKININTSSLVWVVYLTYVGYASLLTPVIMGNTFWIVPLLLVFFSKKLAIKGRKV